MTPVLQTQFVATHGKGNCVQAAVASILDLPLDAVPAFRDAEVMEVAIDRFLFERGLRRICVFFGSGFEWGDAFFYNDLWHPRGECFVGGEPVMLWGKSPRNSGGHAIVGTVRGGNWRMLHDPHPDGTGIQGDPTHVHFIVPLPPR